MRAAVSRGQSAVVSMFSDDPVMRAVPDLVGLDYDGATGAARRQGLHIADEDPDAPRISNFWWEHKQLVVLTQNPPFGSRIDRRMSVAVTLGPPQVPVGARAGSPNPPALSAEADTGADLEVRPPADEP